MCMQKQFNSCTIVIIKIKINNFLLLILLLLSLFFFTFHLEYCCVRSNNFFESCLLQNVGGSVALGVGTCSRMSAAAWRWAWAPAPGCRRQRGVGRGHLLTRMSAAAWR